MAAKNAGPCQRVGATVGEYAVEFGQRVRPNFVERGWALLKDEGERGEMSSAVS